ncbi:MAG TPA: cupin domain-containing protein [Tepidisphaeraceae bacterium]|jgi:anti-sigma factor ChrR (cupin superfamily)|nr:cupin domain-containing protein [Tepidisphaeraceae bacterium]
MDKALNAGGPLEWTNIFQLPDLAGANWERFREGIEIHRLYESGDGPSAALLRYAPGASLQRHIHRGHEHILVLRGSQIDDAGEHSAGTLLVYMAGSSHAITSPGGCVVLIIWERPVAFVPVQKLEEVAIEIP